MFEAVALGALLITPLGFILTLQSTCDGVCLAHQGKYSFQTNMRSVAKLGVIKLNQIQQLNAADSPFLIRKHKEILNQRMRTLQLDTYGLTWAQFVKGVGVGALVVWLLMR